MDEARKLFGTRIRSLRTRLNLTQDQLAERMEMSAQYLSNIERGRENPTFDTLVKLAKALEIEPWEMFVFDPESPDTAFLRKKLNLLLEEADDERLRRIMKALLLD